MMKKQKKLEQIETEENKTINKEWGEDGKEAEEKTKKIK